MTTVQTLSLILLAVVLVLAIWRRLNIGALALAAAFVLAECHGGDVGALVDKMYESFPGEVVVLIAGVSLLFAHLEWSGALGWIVDRVYRLVGSRTLLLPWAGFVIAGGFATMGAFSTAPIALLVPIIARIAGKYPRHFYVMELAAIIAANCCGLSPLNPTGQVVSSAADKAGLHYDKWGLWAISLLTAVIVVAVIQLIDRVRAGRGAPPFATPATDVHLPKEARVNRAYQLCAGLALIVFVICVVKFSTDVGLTSIFLAVVLQLAFRADEAALLRRIPWNSILLLAGLLTYLGLMKDLGTMTAIQNELVRHVHSQTVLVLVIAYLTALLCNIESSTLGVLGLMMTLVTSIFATTGDGFFWVVTAVAVPAALMVMNPIHVAGTLVIANTEAEQQPRLFRNLLGVAVCCLIVAPGVLGMIAMAKL